MKKDRTRTLWANHLLLVMLVLFQTVPVAILAMNSLKQTPEFGTNPLGFPEAARFENFVDAWDIGNYGTTISNSLIYVAATVAITLVLSGAAAYSLARLNPIGQDAIMLYLLIASAIPIWLFLVPLYQMYRVLGLLNTQIGLVALYVVFNAPFAIFLLRSFLIGLPSEFEDAAKVDGATTWQTFTRIILPLSWSSFLAVGLVVGVRVWSEFQIAVIFVNDPARYPVTTSFFSFADRYERDWGLTSAGALITLVPALLIFLLLQRRFIEGFTQGGVKG
jgi:raffinose/stachyose/melibiose transport system permease protein